MYLKAQVHFKRPASIGKDEIQVERSLPIFPKVRTEVGPLRVVFLAKHVEAGFLVPDVRRIADQGNHGYVAGFIKDVASRDNVTRQLPRFETARTQSLVSIHIDGLRIEA